MTRAHLLVAAGAAVIALAIGCASAPKSSGASDDRLYRSRCAACHRLYAPQERTRGEWATLVARMAPRAHLSDAERARLLDYLESHSSDASSGPRR